MAVGGNVPVTVESTLSDAGTVTFSSGDQVTLDYVGDFRQRQPDRQRHQLRQRRRQLDHHIHFDRNPQWRHQHLQLADHTFLHAGPLAGGQYQLRPVEIAAGTISSGTLSLNLLGTNTANFYYEFPSGSQWPPAERWRSVRTCRSRWCRR